MTAYDPRLDQDEFYLLPWARETVEQAEGWDGKRPSDRRHSGRATVADDPQVADGEQATLGEVDQ